MSTGATPVSLLACVVALLVGAPAAFGSTQELTLFSKPITVKPYVGEQTGHGLAPNGIEAPSVPGDILRMDADVVSRPDASAPTLAIQDVMIHHLVYYKGGVGGSAANCGGRFFARGEERQVFEMPDGYGLPNRTLNGVAPRWTLAHMLMNHRSVARTVYVRLRVTYAVDEIRKPVEPLWMDTRGCNPDPVYDVPGGRKKGSTHKDREPWVVPPGYSGRIVTAGGHLHGGGKYVRVTNRTCGNRTIIDSRAYYGMPNHPFYRVRPILHEPSPIAMGISKTAQGIPIAEGDELRLEAGYDNEVLHGRVMNIMISYVHRTPTPRCAPMPTDVKVYGVPSRYRKNPPRYVVPLVVNPTGPFSAVGASPVAVGDYFFAPKRITSRAGQSVTWQFNGSTAHNVTVANGPRGFSSPWSQNGQTFSFTPTVRGTYRMFCSLHPVAMTQELRVG